MDYMLIAVTVVLCAISFWLLIRSEDNYISRKLANKATADDKKKEENKSEDEKTSEDEEGMEEESSSGSQTTIPKSLFIYSVIMVIVTIGIAITLINVYIDNTVWTNLKCMSLLCVMWPLAYIDFKTYRIPNEFIIFGLICRAVILAFELIMATDSVLAVFIPEIIAALALLLAAVLCRLCMKGSIGYGDIKLFIVMGLFLGMNGIWSAIFTSLIVSFFMAVYVLATKKKSKKDVVPFGPALVIGTYVSIFLSGV